MILVPDLFHGHIDGDVIASTAVQPPAKQARASWHHVEVE